MICPCKDCERKGCGEYHSQCKAYLEYAKWKKEVNQRERKLKQIYVKSNAERRIKWKEKN